MKHLVAFPLEDGGTVMVEVDEPLSTGATTRGARPTDMVERARVTYEEALSKIQPVAESIISKLGDLSERPDEVGVEFGLKLSAETGAFIASAGAEATFTIRLLWRRRG